MLLLSHFCRQFIHLKYALLYHKRFGWLFDYTLSPASVARESFDPKTSFFEFGAVLLVRVDTLIFDLFALFTVSHDAFERIYNTFICS